MSERPRKPVSSVLIECEMWFASNAIFQRFGKVKWGRKSESVSDCRWISAAWEYENDPSGGVIAVFRFRHTCRNQGAHRSDSQRFFNAVLKAAVIPPSDAGLLDARVIHRIKCIEPKPEKVASTAVVNVWGRPPGSDIGSLVFGRDR